MNAMPETNADPWFDAVTSDLTPIADRLRALVLAVAPDAVEEIKWSRPCYSVGGRLFCYLQAEKSWMTLGFQHGASLADPGRLLEGTGKDMRHTKIRSLDGLDEQALTALLKQAARIKS